MEKTLFSRHILFASMSQKDVEAIRDDIALFNRIKRTVTRRKSASCASREESEKTADKPDLRRKKSGPIPETEKAKALRRERKKYQKQAIRSMKAVNRVAMEQTGHIIGRELAAVRQAPVTEVTGLQ